MAVFAIVGLNAAKLTYREPPTLHAADVWLIPRLTPEQHKPAAHPAPTAPAPVLDAARAPAKSLIKPPPTPSPLQKPTASGPGPAQGQPAAARPGVAPSEPSAEAGEGVREALRTSVGCDADALVHLTPYERERCNQKVGEMARKGPPFSGIDPLKRGRFDDQAAADERRRANREGLAPPGIAPCTGEGSNFGVGCLPDSAIMHVHPH